MDCNDVLQRQMKLLCSSQYVCSVCSEHQGGTMRHTAWRMGSRMSTVTRMWLACIRITR